VDDGEEHGGENPIVRHFSLVPGEELGDLLKGRAPWFNEVVHVAPWQLNVLRARYVISDVLAPLGQDKGVVGVLHDEGWHADRRKHRPHVDFGHQRHHESKSRWAGRQAFHSSPRCPDLLVPRHVRIDHMFVFPRPPHGGPGSDNFLEIDPISAFNHRVGVALERDQRGGAGRMCGCEQRPRRERAINREEDRILTSEIVEHRGDAVGPLLQGRQRARRHGIGCSRPRLVEEDEPM
jgi:hypothetical protein